MQELNKQFHDSELKRKRYKGYIFTHLITIKCCRVLEPNQSFATKIGFQSIMAEHNIQNIRALTIELTSVLYSFNTYRIKLRFKMAARVDKEPIVDDEDENKLRKDFEARMIPTLEEILEPQKKLIKNMKSHGGQIY